MEGTFLILLCAEAVVAIAVATALLRALLRSKDEITKLQAECAALPYARKVRDYAPRR